jgi:hypothetical protein
MGVLHAHDGQGVRLRQTEHWLAVLGSKGAACWRSMPTKPGCGSHTCTPLMTVYAVPSAGLSLYCRWCSLPVPGGLLLQPAHGTCRCPALCEGPMGRSHLSILVPSAAARPGGLDRCAGEAGSCLLRPGCCIASPGFGRQGSLLILWAMHCASIVARCTLGYSPSCCSALLSALHAMARVAV